MANRKLQAEIERTLKKVSEGVELFESIYEKIHTAVNVSQKEKFEGDLKKEIKKLQRYRDQIKTWASSNDIKDKKSLLDSRKLIETQMERFKALEKDLKTKAYSQAGLNAASKLDPEEQHRDEIRQWISDQTDTLSTLIDALEAEQEQLQITGKKARKQDSSKAERLLKIDHHIERHKHHQNRLEVVLRMIDNGNLKPEQVDEIKEDVKYYIDSHQEDDFEEDELIYDDLNLEEAEVYGFGGDDDEAPEPEPPKTPPRSEKESKEDVKKSKGEKLASPTTPKKVVKSPKEEIKPKAKVPIPSKPTVPQPVEPAVIPTLKYATAAAPKEKEEKKPQSELPTEVPQPVVATTSTAQSIASILMSSTKGKRTTTPPVDSSLTDKGKPSVASSISSTLQATDATHDELVLVEEGLDLQLPGMQDLIDAIPSENSKSADVTASLLETSLLNTTEAADATRSRSYTPLHPYPVPGYYPQTPLSIFSSTLQLFERFENDTLFFAFYHRIGTFQQYLAARELKRQSWRFHKKYQTWFQRFEEPSEVNDAYEQGTYVYFDYEKTWSQKKKDDFRFEYRFLEDDM